MMRSHLVPLLDWHDAHVSFDEAIDGIPEHQRGRTPLGVPHSLWQLVEHMRIAQHDILDFCVNPSYKEKKWPDDYWPKQAAPPDAEAWDASIAAYRRDREAVKRLIQDPEVDLTATIPHGTGQTFLREVLLIADHTSYHVGQLVLVRRLLGIWS